MKGIFLSVLFWIRERLTPAVPDISNMFWRSSEINLPACDISYIEPESMQ